MIDDEQGLEELEEQFPSLSGLAFSSAYRRTLDAGLKVLIAEDGFVVEVSPDGTRKRVMKIDPPIPVKPGTRIVIP